jgi:branched-chain amino acid transport system substrate-binding protein
MRSAVVLVAIATLTLAACGSKSNDSSSSSAAAPAASGASSAAGSAASGSAASGSAASGSAEASGSASAGGGLKIKDQVQIDVDGNEVPVAAGGTPADPAGNGQATCPATTTIAMAGALTGPNAALGINILNGAKVAVDKHNKANANCQVQLKEFDTEGDPQKATQVAPQIVGDQNVIGLLGPAFSGETKATGPIFFQAGLLSLTASATNPALTTNGWTNFFRGLANDAVQGPAVANYMVKTLGYKKVCVVEDNTDYGAGLAEEINKGLGDAADSNCAAKVKTGDKDFSATVQLVKGESPDAVFYAGYYSEAAPFVQQLRDGGVTAPFVSADGTNDPQFVAQAGEASKDAILSCPCGPAPDAYATEYQDLNGAAPGVYSTEGYDLATIMLLGIDSGVKDRAGLIDYVKNYDGTGLARQYKWNSTGELSSSLIWIYKVQ